MGNVWLTSDLHLGHRFVAGLRGFDDLAGHDAEILDNWAKIVRAGDQVWVLGDLAVASSVTKLAEVLTAVRRLPGTKILVPGNHDSCHPMHRDAHRFHPLYLQTFVAVQPFARRRVHGTEALLSHFPYTADHTDEPRYSQYRLPDQGRWLLHGHTHRPEKISGPRQVHVGLDAWGLWPVSLEQVAELIRRQDGQVR